MTAHGHENLSRLILSVNKLLRGMEQFDRAAKVLQKGLQIQKENGTLETLEGADMLHQLGILDRRRQSYESAHQHLQQALEISTKVDSLETTTEGALLYLEIGVLLTEQNKDGLEMLNHAKEVAEKLGKWHTNVGAWIMRYLGQAQYQRKDVARALSWYEQSVEVGKKNDSLHSQLGAQLFEQMAVAKTDLNDFTGAMQDLKEVEKIRSQMHILQTAEGARVLKLLGDTQKQCGESDAASNTYGRAYRILSEMNLL
eukprot:CAMPEP_0169303906 /NCGR_PEP_ID=MMETSP1016-20121227/69605_1 /TAXON_ID=342587 /ORGANISM="Karlodinium micrum, Strain CCMP2283" /LENGTH=255 /DNA_ID=CAMNT_0009396759 /DNA_START=8 /DNA_END=771 /DNA_ORIENTATION=-